MTNSPCRCSAMIKNELAISAFQQSSPAADVDETSCTRLHLLREKPFSGTSHWPLQILKVFGSKQKCIKRSGFDGRMDLKDRCRLAQVNFRIIVSVLRYKNSKPKAN